MALGFKVFWSILASLCATFILFPEVGVQKTALSGLLSSCERVIDEPVVMRRKIWLPCFSRKQWKIKFIQHSYNNKSDLGVCFKDSLDCSGGTELLWWYGHVSLLLTEISNRNWTVEGGNNAENFFCISCGFNIGFSRC